MDYQQIVGIIYCGLSVMCFFILTWYARNVAKTTSRFSIARYVFYSYLFAGLVALFDCAYALREIMGISFPPFWSYLFTIAYVISANLTGTFWIIYGEKKINSWFCRTKKRFVLFTVPFYVLIVLTITTPFTKWFFYFEENKYYRGPLFMIISSLLFVYIVINGVNAFVYSFKKENYVNRRDYKRLFIYAFSYLLIQAVQLILPTVFPYRSVGMTVVFGLFLIQNITEMVGVDALTRINNRYAVDRYLATMMSQNEVFEIALMDIDKFKNINDKYGHIEGDKALKLVTEAIKETAPKNSFVARWGGDEFIIINNDNNYSLLDVEEKTNQCLASLAKKRNLGYRITLSAGFFTKDSSITSIPDLLKCADEKLYGRKRSKKAS